MWQPGDPLPTSVGDFRKLLMELLDDPQMSRAVHLRSDLNYSKDAQHHSLGVLPKTALPGNTSLGGVPDGGLTHQVLTKVSDISGDVDWENAVKTIVEGSGVNIDSSDPFNPIISAVSDEYPSEVWHHYDDSILSATQTLGYWTNQRISRLTPIIAIEVNAVTSPSFSSSNFWTIRITDEHGAINDLVLSTPSSSPAHWITGDLRFVRYSVTNPVLPYSSGSGGSSGHVMALISRFRLSSALTIKGVYLPMHWWRRSGPTHGDVNATTFFHLYDSSRNLITELGAYFDEPAAFSALPVPFGITEQLAFSCDDTLLPAGDYFITAGTLSPPSGALNFSVNRAPPSHTTAGSSGGIISDVPVDGNFTHNSTCELLFENLLPGATMDEYLPGGSLFNYVGYSSDSLFTDCSAAFMGASTVAPMYGGLALSAVKTGSPSAPNKLNIRVVIDES